MSYKEKRLATIAVVVIMLAAIIGIAVQGVGSTNYHCENISIQICKELWK